MDIQEENQAYSVFSPLASILAFASCKAQAWMLIQSHQCAEPAYITAETHVVSGL